jgi:hypothetical protein
MRGGVALRNQEQEDHQVERKLKALELLLFGIEFQLQNHRQRLDYRK